MAGHARWASARGRDNVRNPPKKGQRGEAKLSDEYIANLIAEELEHSCPGETGCHGCQSWCPLCGSVGHVCDDPECNTHRRDVDVLSDMGGIERDLARCAKEVHRLEIEVIETEKELPRWSVFREQSQDRDYMRRRALGAAAGRCDDLEREMAELEEELTEIRAPGSLRFRPAQQSLEALHSR